MNKNTENNMVTDENIRNSLLPLAVAKPKFFQKVAVLSVIALYLMMVITYLTRSFLVNYVFIEASILIILFVVLSNIYDFFYRCSMENTLDSFDIGAVIGYSNKLLILSGDVLIEQFDTDEIRIRAAKKEENEYFFAKHTSVLECYNNGKLYFTLGVDKIPEFENLILKPDYSKSDEDLKIIDDDLDIDGDNEDC